MGLRLGPREAALPGLGLAAGGTEQGPLTDALLPPPMHRFHNNKTRVINQELLASQQGFTFLV